MKRTGIWIDKDKAHIVTLEGKKETLQTIPSNIEHFHIGGGTGTRFKGGPQDVVQDSKYLEREKHQFKQYFKKIAEVIKDSDAIVIFGPANTNKKFNKELQKKYRSLSEKVRDIVRADSMTENQTIAWVKDFFR